MTANLSIKPVLFALFIFSFSACQNSNTKQKDSNVKAPSAILSSAEPAKKADLLIEQSLRDAALEGNSAEVDRMLNLDIRFDAIDSDGRTALMLCCFNGHAQIAQKLIKLGASVNRADFLGRTALMYASTGPYPETVKLLISSKADLNMTDNDEKFSPLMFAAAEGQMEIVKILLENNADPLLKDKDNDTAESFARQNGHQAVADYIGSWIKKK